MQVIKGVIKGLLAVASILLLVVVADVLLGWTEWTRTITSGQFQFLSIGETKDEVIKHVRKVGVDVIWPEPYKRVFADKPRELNKLVYAEGVYLFLRKGALSSDEKRRVVTIVRPELSIWFGFKKGKVSYLDYPPNCGLCKSNFEYGQDKEQAFKHMRNLIGRYPNSYATNFIPNGGFIYIKNSPCDLKSMTLSLCTLKDNSPKYRAMRLHFLKRYNRWKFHGVNQHDNAHYTLYFKHDKLSKIEYKTTLVRSLTPSL